MPDRKFDFQPGDRLIRRVNRYNRNKAGRPTRGAFQEPNGKTSVSLERLLTKPEIPGSDPDDLLVFIPPDWIFDLSLTITPLGLEFTHDAHFHILGELHIEFRDHLRDETEKMELADWIAWRSSLKL